MDETSYILGLMRQNTDALGFIPNFTVERQYIKSGRHLIQSDTRGRRTGYLLHGAPRPGGVLTIAQACIEYDLRQRGHGQDVVSLLLERAQQRNVRAISLRCADDLDANAFWTSLGFERVNVLSPANRRQRKINIYVYALWPTLFDFAAVSFR